MLTAYITLLPSKIRNKSPSLIISIKLRFLHSIHPRPPRYLLLSVNILIIQNEKLHILYN